MNWKCFLKQWLVLVMVLVSVTSCELERYGTGMALPVLECQPGEWEYKGKCVPAGLPPDMQCPPGELLLDDGRCQPAGLPPDMPCPPGETLLDYGQCQPAGVPPEMCGEGFEPDGKMGCNAILPAEACPFGLMAVPGETECHEVAPCGAGTWGDIPVDETTQFVNGAYAGNDSDGTKERPWKTIADGIWEADAGAIVAVAEGTYQENLYIGSKPVKLWGVCPKKVAVIGISTENPTIEIVGTHADGTVIHNLAITSASSGLGVYSTSGVSVDHVWIHDTDQSGLNVLDYDGPANVSLSASLLEKLHAVGIEAMGAEVIVIKSIVRDATVPKGAIGGVNVIEHGQTQRRAKLKIQGSLLEKLQEIGVQVTGSDLDIETSVVRNIGRQGIHIQANAATRAHSSATISAIVVEKTTTAGIVVSDSGATIKYTALRRIQLDESGRGTAINIQQSQSAKNSLGRANVKITGCVVDGSAHVGVYVLGSDATIESTIVRNTISDNAAAYQTGIMSASTGNDLSERANITVRSTIVENNGLTGVRVDGADLTLENSIVRGQGSYGFFAQYNHETDTRSVATIRRSIVDKNRNSGVVALGSDLEMVSSLVRDTLPEDGLRGVGVTIQADWEHDMPASGKLYMCRIERNRQQGIRILNANATIDTSVIYGTTSGEPSGAGWGIEIEGDSKSGPSDARIENSVVDCNQEVGLLIKGANATIDTTIVRNTMSNSQGISGIGFYIQDSEDHLRSNVTINASIVEKNRGLGIIMIGSDVTANSIIVRNTMPDAQGFGRGIEIQKSLYLGPSIVKLRGSLVEYNHEVGLISNASEVEIDATIVRDTKPNEQGLAGQGINIHFDEQAESPNATIRNCLIADNHEVGLYLGSSRAVVEKTTIRSTKVNALQEFGDGVAVFSEFGTAFALLTDVRIEDSARASISNFGGNLDLQSSTLECSLFDMSTQPFNELTGSFKDAGGNRCGCPDATRSCRMANAILEPPLPLPLSLPVPPLPEP